MPFRRGVALALFTLSSFVAACGGAPGATPASSIGDAASGTPAVSSSAPGGASAGPVGSAAPSGEPATSASGAIVAPSAAAASSAASTFAAASVPPSTASAPASVAPSESDGTATIGIPALGLSMRLPTGWVGLDATVPTSIIEGTEARYPDLADSLAKLRTSELGFVGYDATAASPPTPNLTIATTGDAIPVASLLDALARQTAEHLARTEKISDVEHAGDTLAAGPAAELRYRWTPSDAVGPVAVDAWFVSTAGHTFVLTFTVPAGFADEMRPAIRAAADSLSGS